MKKILYSAIILFTAGYIYAASERREYAVNISPGELYFLEIKNVVGGTYTFTNNVDYMWYPERIESWYASTTTSTNSLAHVMKHVENKYLDSQVVTNDFGNVETNYLHVLTNTVTTYVTNTICTWTNTDTYSSADVDDTFGHFIQKGDILVFSFSNTSSAWLRYTGRR